MAGSHSFSLGDQLVERLLRSESRPSSRNSSRPVSRCSSNRGSIYSEVSTEPSIKDGGEEQSEEFEEEDTHQLTVSNVCNTCREEKIQMQALSVQEARQRYYFYFIYNRQSNAISVVQQNENSRHDFLF